MHAALVHIGRQHFDSLGPRLVDVLAEFRGIGHVVRHHGAVKLHRIIRFQISRLIRDDGVGGGVGFVEAVAGKFFEQIEDLVGLVFGNMVLLLATFDKDGALLGHLFDFLFSHGAPEHVRRSERVAGQHLRRLHHLLLINHDPVGLTADWLQQRMFIVDFDLSVPAGDEFRNKVHRSRSIKRDESRDMFDGTDLEFSAEIAHAAGFQLENAQRIGLVQKVVGLGIVERQMINWNIDAPCLFDHLAGIANHGQGF